MQTNARRYILELNGFEGSESRFLSKTQTGNHCPRTTRSCWWTCRAHQLLTRVTVP